MEQIDKVVRKALNLQPVLGAQSTGVAPRSKSTIFEDNETTDVVHRDWYFSYPGSRGKSITALDLPRLLKQFDMNRLVRGECDPNTVFTQFTQELNRLKKQCSGGEEAKEEELLCYLNSIDVLNKVFENNTTPYSYSVRSADDNEPYYTIQSDKFLFEYLNTLIALLAHYNNQAIERAVDSVTATTEQTVKRDFLRRASNLFHLSTEVLTEILNQCRAPRETHKLVYTEPLRSMGSASTEQQQQQQQSGNLPLQEFICSFLGGEAAIEARIHLCNAKKYEMINALFRLNTGMVEEDSIDAKLARLSNIYHAYKQAYEAIRDCPLNKSLYNHCRFLSHVWFCRAQLLVVKQSSAELLSLLQDHEETEDELNLAREHLARLLYVTAEAKKMEEKERDVLDKLSQELAKSYNMLLQELQSLTKSFDVELYDNRRVKEMKGVDFTLHMPQVVKRKNNLFIEARKGARKKFVERMPVALQCQQLLGSLLEKLTQGSVDECLKIFPSSSSVASAGTMDIVMDRSLRIGHLTEREWWLDYLVSLYSHTDGEFTLRGDLYQRFVQELDAVKQTKRQVQ